MKSKDPEDARDLFAVLCFPPRCREPVVANKMTAPIQSANTDGDAAHAASPLWFYFFFLPEGEFLP